MQNTESYLSVRRLCMRNYVRVELEICIDAVIQNLCE
jgi:hypothetical protein